MGLFNKKSEEEKKAENKINELCGGFLGNKTFKKLLEENHLSESTPNLDYKMVLKNEVKNKTLNYDNIENRLNELMKLDVDSLNNKIRMRYKEDTSLFKTQQNIDDFLGHEYAEKHNKSLEKAKAKNIEKERKRAEKEEEKRIRDLEKERKRAEKEEENRIKNLEKEKLKIKKLEDKYNITLTGKKWFECTIEEIKYSTFQNEPRRNIDHAYVIINIDNVEILKESMWIKSNMGTRKIFYENIASIDFDARGKFHASSSLIINTKSAEHVQLKNVNEKNYNLLNNAFENYIKKPQETQVVSQSSKADDLVKYAELFEKGLITKEEFDKMKNEVIHGVSDSNVKGNVNLDYKEKNNSFCSNCGCEIEIDAKFCSSCGNKLN